MRFCVRCGRTGDELFRSDRSLKCLDCDEVTIQDRKEYHRDYHKARAAAVRRLVAAHRQEYDKLLTEEREKS